MLAELSAANAAYQVIKTCVQNSGEIASAAQSIFQFAAAEKALTKKTSSQTGQSDLEAFMALEQVRQMRADIEQIMIYSGRPGLLQDFKAYEQQALQQRRAEEKKAAAIIAMRKYKIWKAFEYAITILLSIFAVGLIAWLAYMIKTKGNF